MTDLQRQQIDRILNEAKGDDLYRAQAAFRGCTPEQMQQNYGESGVTRQSIMDGYVKHEAHIEALRKALAEAK